MTTTGSPLRRLVATALVLGAGRCLAAAPAAVGHWSFDGNLRDDSGRGNHAHAAKPVFGAGHQGQAVDLAREAVVIQDSAELRLQPGLRLECWVRFASQPTGIRPLVVKPDEYMLRANPEDEGGSLAFFVSIGGDWERRVQSASRARPGVWYHVVAAWDGQAITLTVNDEVVRGERTGTPLSTGQPVTLGPVDGALDELRLDNPNATAAGVACWPFDGDLRDASGHGHDLTAPTPTFVPGACGQALQLGSARLEVPDHPDVQLAPGLRIDCSVRFATVPTAQTPIVIKDNEYQLRVNPSTEDGALAFFANLGGWEPRVVTGRRVEAGVWYRISAQWDGLALTLDVNGERTQVVRSGSVRPTANPLQIGGFAGLIDELRIENPKRPVLRVQDWGLEHTLLRAGQPERLTAVIRNHGSPAAACGVSLTLSPALECVGSRTRDLGALATGAETTVEWTVRAPAPVTAMASLRLVAQDCAPMVSRQILAFLPAQDSPATLAAIAPPPRPANSTATTYYVDSAGGDNANAGTSPETAWRDFTNANGKALGPGERLLIKAGSVINQELSLSAAGTAEAWAEIGAYGNGPRPIIRRNWDIDERCALVRNPSFLAIRGLVVSHAGKGLVVSFSESGHRGLLITDCIAHHIEGLYRLNSHGIPEWRDRVGARGDGSLHSSAGFAIVGAPAEDLVLRDCEMFQCSWGFFVNGDGVIIDRVFCHDNIVHNTSPHPALVASRRSYLQNSIFDAPGWHAFAGTMGIMLCDPQGLVIRNCVFRNQPDSGSHDEGGIDFENHGNGCLIEHCTFRNNAGAAIEVLGLKTPQTRNIEIANSRFIRNNTARKLGPAEVYVWGKSPSADVCCSTGIIHDNGYVLEPGVEFFVNEAPKTTRWTLRDNTAYASVEELERAMPFNDPPVVEAGPEAWTADPAVRLAGTVRDDDRPTRGRLAVAWEVLEGPGSVTFEAPASPQTLARFSAPGDYWLRLRADDGELWLSDTVAVHVLPPGTAVAKAWGFSGRLDKEGWSEASLGTRVQEWTDQAWPCVSQPVQYVAGGYYLIAVENSTDAHLLSATDLGLDLAANKTVRIRFQNHTPATRMRLRFTTDVSPAWADTNGQDFAVVANDTGPREYTVAMAGVPDWRGRLRQLRLDLATGAPLTGTCRIDYLWIGNLAPP